MNDKALVEKIIKLAVKKANSKNKLMQYTKEKTEGEQRIAYIRIYDLDAEYWIGFDGEHIIQLDKNSAVKPTTIFIMSSDTFFSIVLGKITPVDAVYLGHIQIEGDFWMRDLALFEQGIENFFNEVKEVLSA